MSDTKIDPTKITVEVKTYLKMKADLEHYKGASLALLDAMAKLTARLKVLNEVNLHPQLLAMGAIIREACEKASPKNELRNILDL